MPNSEVLFFFREERKQRQQQIQAQHGRSGQANDAATRERAMSAINIQERPEFLTRAGAVWWGEPGREANAE